jgi:uncharacterized protein
MRKIVIVGCLFLSVLITSAQTSSVCGSWMGTLSVQSLKLRIGLEIKYDSGKYNAQMISIDQGYAKIPVDKIITDGDSLKLLMKQMSASYTGLLSANNDSLSGFLKQGGCMRLNFTRVDSILIPKRPQDPKPPYPYNSIDVTFANQKDNVILGGTLTVPKTGGPFPAVVLVSGSGQQNRDEELMGHKPFAVIADYLTRNGIAVLRYDDRGVGKSSGNPANCTSFDFSNDAEAAFEYLRKFENIDSTKVGIAGHSEGGMIAPLVASRNDKVSFIIMLAGPGVSGKKILLAQNDLISKVDGTPQDSVEWMHGIIKEIYDIVLKTKDNKKTTASIKKFVASKTKDMTDDQKKNTGLDPISVSRTCYVLTTPWMRYFLATDPGKFLKKVKCPVLAVNGSKDLQVPSVENLKAIKSIFQKSGNTNVMVKQFEGLNHLFQECKTGSPSEYAEIEMTFSPVVLETLGNWIKALK